MSYLSPRNLSLDLLRAIAIVCVVLLHIVGGSWQNSDLSVWSQYIYRLLTVMGYLGVPLFLMVSGALLLPKFHSLREFFRHRFVRVVPPWIFYGVVMILSQVYLQLISHQPLVLPKLHHIYVGTYWFVPLILGLYLFTPLINYLQSVNPHSIAFLFWVWFLIFSLLPTLTALYLIPSFLAVSPGRTLQLYGYYLAGYLLQKSKYIAPQLLLLGLLTSIFIHVKLLTVFDQHHSPSYYAAYINPLTVVASLTLAKLLLQSRFSSLPRVITILALVSFGTYLIHPIVLNFLRFSLFDLPLPPAFKPLIHTSLLLWLSASVVYLLQKIPLTKRLAG